MGKGVGLIIDALALLKDIRFKMFFIGNGYACGEMKEKIEQYGLSDRIKLMGVLLDRSDIKRYYAAADLFLFPSMYDNAPLVLREAAAMHTPAILLNGATASEVIVDGGERFSDGKYSFGTCPEDIFSGRIASDNTSCR